MKQSKSSTFPTIRKFTPSALCALLAFSSLGTDRCFGGSASWALSGSGIWQFDSNWSPNTGFPGITDSTDVATLATALTGDATISLTSPRFVEEIIFNNATYHYTVSVSAFDLSQQNFTLDMLAGSHTLASNITASAMTNDVIVSGVSGTTLTISGTITSLGGLQMNSAGTLILDGGFSTYPGTTTISSGTLQTNTMDVMGPGLVDLSASGAVFNLNGQSQIIENLTSVVGSTVQLNGATLTIGNAAPAFTSTVAGVIGVAGDTGSFAFGPAAGSTLTLSGTNLYSGGTSLKSGTLNLVAGANLGSGTLTFPASGTGTLGVTATPFSSSNAITLTGNGNIDVGSSNVATFSGLISGAGTLTLSGAGTFAPSGTSNNYSGGTNITAGIVSISGNSNLGSGTVTLSNSSTLEVTSSLTLANAIQINSFSGPVISVPTVSTIATFSGVVTGSTQLLLDGPGTLVLTNANNYFSNAIWNGGTLSISNANQLGSDEITFGGTSTPPSGGTLEITANITISNPLFLLQSGTILVNSPITANLSGQITDPGKLIMDGTGTLVLSNTSVASPNNYTGGTSIIGGGTIEISQANQLGTGDFTFDTPSGGVFAPTQGITFTSAFHLDATNSFNISSSASLFSQGTIDGSVVLNKDGDGILGFLLPAKTYTGGTNINAGTLECNKAGVMPTTGTVTIASGATFELSGNAQTIGNLSGVSGALVALDGATLTVGDATNQEYDGAIGTAISPAGTIVKEGGGKLTLGGTNFYNGGTVLTGGILSISSDANLGATIGNVIFGTPVGTLEVTLSTTLTRGFTLNNPGIISVDSGTNVTISGLIQGGSPLTVEGLGTLIFSNASNSYSGGLILQGGGTLSISNDHDLGTPGVGVPAVTFVNGTLDITNSLSSAKNFSIPTGGAGTIDIPTAANTVTLSGVISTLPVGATSGLTKLGAGTLVLSGTNSYQGGTFIGNATTPGGIVQVSNDANLGAPGGTQNDITFGYMGGTLEITGGFSTPRDVVFEGPATIIVDGSNIATFSGAIVGNSTGPSSVGFTMDGTGTLVLSYPSNTYIGGTFIVGGGTLSINADSELGADGITFGSPSGGTLEITGNIPSPSTRSIVLTQPGAISVGSAFSAMLPGVISGPSSLTVTGAGELVLTGTNTYQGGTFITGGGTLAVAADANLGDTGISAAVSFAGSGGVLEITQNGFNSPRELDLGAPATVDTQSGVTATLSGLITGSDGLTVDGFGTLVLSNSSNNYLSGTSIVGGTLSIAQDGSLGNINGDITFANGGILDITQDGFSSNRGITLTSQGAISIPTSDTATLTGVISGTDPLNSTLTKDGPGTLILTGTNTYLGGTVIAGGALQITQDSNLGDPSGAVTIGPAGELNITGNMSSSRPFDLSSGTEGFFVAFNRTATLSGTITGGSDFTKLGTGTLILTGANNYTGTTNINAGELQGTTDSIPGNVLNNSSAPTGFVLDQAFDGVFAGNITGSGTFAKLGTGSVSLTGTSNFSGDTLVEEGTLLINGVVTTADVVVSLGAILGGSGTINGDVDVYGTIAPGNSIGTLTVGTGNYTQFSGSTLTNEINPTSTDLINVETGNIIIDTGATFDLLVDPGTYVFPTTYTIAQAPQGGVTGTFDTLTSNLPGIKFSLIYNATNIQLLLSGVNFSFIVTEGNPGAVAHCVDMSTAPAGSDFITILDLLQVQSTAEMYNSFNEMQPSAFKALVVSQQNIILEVENSLNDRYIAYEPTACEPQYKHKRGLWLESFGSFQSQDKENVGHYSTAPASTTKAYGILAGVDTPVGDGFTLGALTGYSRGNISFHDDVGNGNVQTLYLGPYAGYGKKHYYLNASILGQANWYETNRNINFASRSAHSFHEGQGALMHVGVGGWLTYSKIDISPFVNFDYIFMEEDFYAESGASSLNLRVQASTYQFTEVEAGFLFRTCAKIRQGLIIPEIRLSVISENRYQGQDYRASLPDTGGCSFLVKGYYPNRVLFSPEAKLKALLYHDRLTASIYYQGKYGDGFSQSELGIALDWAF